MNVLLIKIHYVFVRNHVLLLYRFSEVLVEPNIRHNRSMCYLPWTQTIVRVRLFPVTDVCWIKNRSNKDALRTKSTRDIICYVHCFNAWVLP